MICPGWLYDGLGSYDSGFYVAGTVITLSGLMLFCIPLVETLQAPKGFEEDQECEEGKSKFHNDLAYYKERLIEDRDRTDCDV